MLDSPSTSSLASVIRQSYVLTYKENASPLLNILQGEGLHPQEIRATYSEEELGYVRNTRTLMNHYAAWCRAKENFGYTLICESDFVPCAGLGGMRTFWPEDNPLAWGYLYQGSPRVLSALGGWSFLRAHASPLVAYVINAPVAKLLCDFFHDQISEYGYRTYFAFDAHLQWFVMSKGAEAFIPTRHYGEHGGLPNPDHNAAGLARAGKHRADNLARRLAFLPEYARGSRFRFVRERLYNRALGWGRLLTNRWITTTSVYQLSAMDKARLNMIGLVRLLR